MKIVYEQGRKDRALCTVCGYSVRLVNEHYVEHTAKGYHSMADKLACPGSGQSARPMLDYVQHIVENAPPLTQEQRSRVKAMFDAVWSVPEED